MLAHYFPRLFCNLPSSISVSIFASAPYSLTSSWNTTLFLLPTLLLYSFPFTIGFQSPSRSHPSLAHQTRVQPLVRYLPAVKTVYSACCTELFCFEICPVLSLAFPQVVSSSWVLSFHPGLTHLSNLILMTTSLIFLTVFLFSCLSFLVERPLRHLLCHCCVHSF